MGPIRQDYTINEAILYTVLMVRVPRLTRRRPSTVVLVSMVDMALYTDRKLGELFGNGSNNCIHMNRLSDEQNHALPAHDVAPNHLQHAPSGIR